jgi:hypothetical protein
MRRAAQAVDNEPEAMEASLTGLRSVEVASPGYGASADPMALSDPFDGDLSPWLLRRLELANNMAWQLRDNADSSELSAYLALKRRRGLGVKL